MMLGWGKRTKLLVIYLHIVYEKFKSEESNVHVPRSNVFRLFL